MLVFFTWWQSLGISVLFYMGFIPPYSDKELAWSAEDVSKAIQDYLICIEMFLFAVVHLLVFPYTDYISGRVGGKRRRLAAKYRRGPGSNDNLDSDNTRIDRRLGGRGVLGSQSSIPGPMRHNIFGRKNYLKRPIIRGHDNKDDKEGTLPLFSLKSTDRKQQSVLQHRQSNNSHYDNEEDYEDDSSSSDYEKDRPGFFKALWQSTVPEDLMNNSIGIIKGDYKVEKNTLLSHSLGADRTGIVARAREQNHHNRQQQIQQQQKDRQSPGITTNETSDAQR